LRGSAKIGLSYYRLGDKEVMNFFNQIHSDTKDHRIFPLVGINISKTVLVKNFFSINGMADLAAEAPEAEALFINVKKMMGKPYWSGNPNLDQPIRTTVRTNLSIPHVNLDLFGSYIFNYVYLDSAINGMQKYQTFGNVDALLMGGYLKLAFNFFESEVSYTYGENESNGQPLIEILPLHISNRLYFPVIINIQSYIQHTYENAQKRVDPSLMENPSESWNRIDFGMNMDYGEFMVGIRAENILNANYSKHLSYVRNPFSSGMKIIEPGRSLRLNFRYRY
jgi:iron complex outermembrane receptor protein